MVWREFSLSLQKFWLLWVYFQHYWFAEKHGFSGMCFLSRWVPLFPFLVLAFPDGVWTVWEGQSVGNSSSVSWVKQLSWFLGKLGTWRRGRELIYWDLQQLQVGLDLHSTDSSASSRQADSHRVETAGYSLVARPEYTARCSQGIGSARSQVLWGTAICSQTMDWNKWDKFRLRSRGRSALGVSLPPQTKITISAFKRMIIIIPNSLITLIYEPFNRNLFLDLGPSRSIASHNIW